MNNRDALMRAVLLHPGEDAPKLALADWFEEHGTPEERERAARMRVAEVPKPELLGRMNKTARGWYDYAAGLLAGVVPKTWTVWPIERGGRIPSRSAHDAHRGEDSLSWTYAAGICHFQSSRPYFVVCLRHGFVAGVAAPAQRLRKVLPKLFAAQPVVEVAQTNEFLEFEHFLRHVPLSERGRGEPRCIRRTANRVPQPVWDRLTPDPWGCGYSDTARTYPNHTAAYEDLSRAWVAWGREQAGLPTVPR